MPYALILAVRILHALLRLCPAAPPEAARAVLTVALLDRAPLDAAARLIGAGMHETGFRTQRQAKGGPAVTWWQLEVPAREREELLADPLAAPRLALRRARACRGSLRGYAWGKCQGGGPAVDRAAAELDRAVATARAALGD